MYQGLVLTCQSPSLNLNYLPIEGVFRLQTLGLATADRKTYFGQFVRSLSNFLIDCIDHIFQHRYESTFKASKNIAIYCTKNLLKINSRKIGEKFFESIPKLAHPGSPKFFVSLRIWLHQLAVKLLVREYLYQINVMLLYLPFFVNSFLKLFFAMPKRSMAQLRVITKSFLQAQEVLLNLI